jgi:hypothetical protein
VKQADLADSGPFPAHPVRIPAAHELHEFGTSSLISLCG